MSKHVLNIMLLIALVSGAAVFVGIYRYMSPNAANQDKVAEVGIVIATTRIDRGTVIEAEHLAVEKVAQDERPQGALNRKSAAVGRMTRETIPEGAMLVESALVPQGKSSVLTMLPKGYRAATVMVDARQDVERYLSVGDRVDVVVTVGNSSREGASSKLVLQNVEVLMVPKAGRDDARRQKGESPITLAVLPADAEKLSLAMSVGSVQLLVRGYDDKSETGTSGVTQDTLLPVDARNYEQASAYHAVEVIKGVERRKERFHSGSESVHAYRESAASAGGSPVGGIR